MHDNIKDKINLFLRHRIPLMTTLMLMFLFYLPINSLEFNYFRPAVGVICVYYWTLKREYMFSYISAFMVGFLMDAYSSIPLGINILMMMVLVFITKLAVRYFKSASFVGSWLLFGFVGLLLIFIKWLLVSIYFGGFIPLMEIMVNFLSTLMFYPLVAYINIWVQANLLPQERINE